MANPFDQFDVVTRDREPTRVTITPDTDAGGAGRFAAPKLAGNPFDQFDAPKIDFDRPVEAVRADISKLKGPERDQALREWADHFVAKENAAGGVVQQGSNAVRTLARGTFVGPWLDEITAGTHAAQNAVGLGGAPYDEALAYQRARDRAVDTNHPVASFTGQLAGGIAGGGAALRAGPGIASTVLGGPLAQITPAASTVGRVAQASGVGAAYGANAGAGNAEGETGDRLAGAQHGAAIGTLIGAGSVPVIAGLSAAANVASPTIARYAQNARNLLGRGGPPTNAPPSYTQSQRELMTLLEGVAASDGPDAAAARAAAQSAPRPGAHQEWAQWASDGPASRIGYMPARALVEDIGIEAANPGRAAGRPQPGGSAATGTPYVGQQPPLPPITGADAAANQLIANQLMRAEVPFQELRNRLVGGRWAREIDPNVRQPSADVLADMDSSLAKLAGSAARQNPEAGNIARSVTYGRQTGLTPQGGMPDRSGIPTRNMLEGADPSAPPMGQTGRLLAAMRQTLDIPAGSALQQEAAMAGQLEQTARPLYRQTYQAAQGVDMAPIVRPLAQEWRNVIADQVDPLVSRQLTAAVSIVERALAPGRLSSFERLNTAKISIDEMIGRAMRSPDRRSPNLARMLTEMKNQLVGAMDGVDTVGPMYRNARGMFSSHHEMTNAIDLGRAALRENSEISVAQYAELTPGQQRMFRLGLYDAAAQRMGGAKRTADASQIFESPRVQELLEAVIPQGAGDRAARFGQIVNREKSMVGTKNEILGNSKTAERLSDDEAWQQGISLIDDLRSTRGVGDAAFKIAQATLDKMFGFRADTAAAVARKLLTADPTEIGIIMDQIERRMGPSRAAHFARMVQAHRSQIVGSSATATTSGRDLHELPPPAPQPPRTPPNIMPTRPNGEPWPK